MNRPRALLDVPFPAFIAELFTPHCELLPWTTYTDTDDVIDTIDAIISFSHTPIGDAEYDRLPNVKVVSNYGVGVDHIDVSAAKRHHVVVGNTPGAVDGATADQTFALMLSIARNTVAGDAHARGPHFHAFDPGFLLGADVFGATLGIVGMGRIGREVAKRARGFDMPLYYHNRHRDHDAEHNLGARYLSLTDLLAQSDFVCLNVPLTPETDGLIGERELRRMKPTAFLINTARGAVVDTDALERALTQGWIAGAGLDVTQPEPLPRDHPLLHCPNLVITPHLGTSTYGTRRRMGEITRDNLLAGLAGKPLPFQVMA